MISKKQLLKKDKWDWMKMAEHRQLIDNGIHHVLLQGHIENRKDVIYTTPCRGDLEKAIAVEKINNKLIELGYETKLEVVQELDVMGFSYKEKSDHWRFTIRIGE